MTRDCLLNCKKNTSWEHVVYKNFFFVSVLTFKTIFVLYTTCCEFIFFLEFNEQSLVILWVNWCKNEGFWKRFTCTGRNSLERESARQGFVALKEYLSVRKCWKKIPKEILEIRPVRNCTFLLLFDAPKGMLGCWLGH